MGFIASILSGGATGLLGVAVQRVFDHLKAKEDRKAAKERMEHEISMRKADAEIMAQEWAARTKVAEIETSGKVDVADAEAFKASFNEPELYSERVKVTRAQGWFLVVLDFIRGIVRPFLTVYLCTITTVVYLQARELMGGVTIDPSKANDLLTTIVNTILYLTTTCVLWWFGTRNKSKAPQVA